MNILIQSAIAWKELTEYRYQFLYGYKKTLYTINLSFSYEDYLEFLLLFEKIISSEPEENENAKEKTQQSDSLYSLYENSKLPSLALAQMLDI